MNIEFSSNSINLKRHHEYSTDAIPLPRIGDFVSLPDEGYALKVTGVYLMLSEHPFHAIVMLG